MSLFKLLGFGPDDEETDNDDFPDVPEGALKGLLQVAADASRCVQCGVCGYNCPVGIQVREYARRGENVTDSRCIACGLCVQKCPRGTLRWGPAVIARPDFSLEVDPDALPEMLEVTPNT